MRHLRSYLFPTLKRSFGLVVYGLCLLAVVGCSNGIAGSGVRKSEVRALENFGEIRLGGAMELSVEVSTDSTVTVEADDNLLPHIKTEVEDEILTITSDNISSSKIPVITITTPTLLELKVSGASTAQVNGLKNETLEVEASGASKIQLEGTTTDLEVEASGASQVTGGTFVAKKADLAVSGASSIELDVSDELTADASGSSKIIYHGSPKILKDETSGTSTITSK